MPTDRRRLGEPFKPIDPRKRRRAGLPRQQAHQLIDQLPKTQLSALVGLLEAIVDPVAAALRNAPEDDEPETADFRFMRF